MIFISGEIFESWMRLAGMGELIRLIVLYSSEFVLNYTVKHDVYFSCIGGS